MALAVFGAALLFHVLGELMPGATVVNANAAVAAAEPGGFQRVTSVAELDKRLQAAGRPVMLDFYADWCVSCKEYERFTFREPKVRDKLDDLLLLQVDVTENTADDKALLKRFGLFGPPGIVFFDAKGDEVTHHRVIGYEPSEQFLLSLQAAGV
jgi:thiol:disulfide interchange protein DsbD